MQKSFPQDLVSRLRACRETGITPSRLAVAIQNQEIPALRVGTRTIKVSLTDVRRLISTPPSTNA